MSEYFFPFVRAQKRMLERSHLRGLLGQRWSRDRGTGNGCVSSSQSGLHGGTSQVSIAGASVTIGGDIIIAVNGTRIRGINDLSTYLENTLPGTTINVTVIRSNQVIIIPVKLGTRSTTA